MIANRLSRQHGKKLAMTEPARIALLAYFRERLSLLRAIVIASDRSGREHPEIRKIHKRRINRDTRAIERAIALLVNMSVEPTRG